MLIRMNAYSLNRKMPKMYSVWDLARCIVAVILAMLPSMSFAQFPLPQTPEATRIAARTIPNAGDTIPLISENEASDSSETSAVTADSEPTTPPTPPKEEELFVAARVIAVVGEERVLLGDMVPPSVLNKMSISNPAFEANLRKGLAS